VLTRDLLLALPKTELHVHLDGSLRPATMIDLARDRNHPLPTSDPVELAHLMEARDGGSLEEYLERFAGMIALMQRPEAMERVAYELAEDNALENVRYMEVRFSPALHTRDGMSLVDAVEAPLRGLARARERHGIRAALIICGIRNMDPAASRELADLTVAFKDRGVVAFDLAGAEDNHPAKHHRDAFFTVINANMATTIHAGEAHGPKSIHQALHYCRANRIGHGTRLYEDPELQSFVRDFRIPLEVCLTSNVQTRAVPSFEHHPLRRYFDAGLVVTLCTDNRLVSGTTLTDEYLRAHRHQGFTWEELKEVALMGFRSAFLPWDDKVEMVEGALAEMEALGR
jgi:adenosine deaminase